MKRRAFLISAAATLAGLSVPVFSTVLGKCSLRGAFPDRELTVDTTEGPVVGSQAAGRRAEAYIGIPYAKTPVGAKRWKAPEAPAARDRVLFLGNRAPKGTSGTPLTLSIWRPEGSASNLPVVFTLEDGKYDGDADHASIDGASLSAALNAVVVVARTRPGLFGFVSLPALRHGTKLENSGNFALLDARKALLWVKNNIAKFGGSASSVTLVGTSGAGRDVMAVIGSPVFSGLFSRAIVISGGGALTKPDPAARIDADSLARLAFEDRKAGTVGLAAKWIGADSAEVRRWLSTLETSRILNLTRGAPIRDTAYPRLFADGAFLPASGLDRAGPPDPKASRDFPVLLLSGASEANALVSRDPYFAAAVKDSSLLTNPASQAEFSFASRYGNSLMLWANTAEAADRAYRFGNHQVFAGIFRWGDDEAVVGATAKTLHGSASDVPSAFIFGPSKNFGARYGGAVRTAGGQELLSITRSYVKNFIRTGNPNGENLVTWAPWGETGNALVLDADRTKAWADTEPSRVDLASTFRQMDDDQTVTPDAKAKLIWDVLSGYAWSQPLEAKFGVPNDLFAGTVPKTDIPASEDDAA